METSIVHKKLQEFAKPTYISVDQFLTLLKQSSRTHKMNIRWMTEGSADGSGKPPHMTQHLIWWDSSKYVGGDAGGSDVKALQDQFNLEVTPGTNNWRTLSYQNIESVSYRGRNYKIR